MAKLAPTQRKVLEAGEVGGASFAMTTTWWLGNEKVTPAVKALLAKHYMMRKSLGGGSHVAIITDAGRAALASADH